MGQQHITFGKLKKYLTCQSYFVWHDFSDLNFSDDNSFFEEDNIIFKIADTVDNIDNYLTSQVQIQTYGKVKKEFKKFIEDNRKLGIIKSKTTEEKIIETKKLMKDHSVEVILNGVWEWKNAAASPTLFFKKEGKISNLKITSSTKRIDLIKPYFDFNVLSNNGIKIKDISYFTINIKDYKAFEIDFYETYKVNTSKGARSSKAAKESFDYNILRGFKTGNGFDRKGPNETNTIYEIISQRLPIGSVKEPITFGLFDHYLAEIEKAKEAKFSEDDCKFDMTPWGANSKLGEIIEHYFPQYSGFSGNLFSKDSVFIKVPLATLATESVVLNEILDGEIKVHDASWLKEIINLIKSSRVIWYDFESFSIPYPTIDHFLPYQHASFQTSIIETINEKESRKENLVFDPITFKGKNFVEVIEKIYSDGADAYIVYNESYENTRLKEMVQNLGIIKHPKTQECREKVEWIIAHTIDLNKAFQCHKNKLPVILVPELKGKSSIKLVEKFITKKNYNFAKLIKPYKELEVQNGTMAMDIAIKRVLNIIGDNEWAEKVESLKKYCENDVRAMMMVYEFIKHVMS